MISKISLGTVQFGQDYGITNMTGKVSKKEVFKILDYAKQNGVCFLDTAYAYGESEQIIGEYLKEKPGEFKIISKLSPMEPFSLGKVEKYFGESLNRIGFKKMYGYLLHQFSDILLSDSIWNSLVRLKNNGQIEKIGFSLYSPEELLFLLEKNLKFDIIQAPYSVFDRRFEKYFSILKERNVEIQVRSVFLQGLAFLNLDNLPESLLDAKPKLEKLRQIALNSEISLEAICLNFVFLNTLIDRVIIGVDNLVHLKNNMACINQKDYVEEIYDQLGEIKIEDEDILLPYKWSVN